MVAEHAIAELAAWEKKEIWSIVSIELTLGFKQECLAHAFWANNEELLVIFSETKVFIYSRVYMNCRSEIVGVEAGNCICIFIPGLH